MATRHLVVLDEISPMELYSDQFKRAITDVLNGPRPLLGTIALKSYPYLDKMKQHERVELYSLTVDNRDSIAGTVTHILNRVIQNNHEWVQFEEMASWSVLSM